MTTAPPDPNNEAAPVDRSRELNKFAFWSLLCTCVLLFPVGLVLGVLGLWQIRKTREGGAPMAIIAIVAGLLAPAVIVSALYGNPENFDVCFQTQQFDGLPVMRLIRYLEEGYHEEHGRYGSLDEVGFQPQIELRNYKFVMEHYDATSFRVYAHGKNNMDGDLLYVDESSKVTHVRDLCKLGRPTPPPTPPTP